MKIPFIASAVVVVVVVVVVGAVVVVVAVVKFICTLRVLYIFYFTTLLHFRLCVDYLVQVSENDFSWMMLHNFRVMLVML